LLAGEILSQISQPVATIHETGLVSLSSIFIIGLLVIYLSLRGKSLSDEKIRPLYARNLSERLFLQAEVRAAREAQLRLMPEKLPNLPGLSIAAECRPAREVGGDFYDIYRLDENRVAVILADSSSQGLGSALSIAFAAGYLRPLVTGSLLGDNSPVEILRSLLNQVGRQFDQTGLTDPHSNNFDLGFLIAIIDRVDLTLHFARTGKYPSVRVATPNGVVSPVESVLSDISISTGVVEISTGQVVLFTTDGIERNSPGPDYLLNRLFPLQNSASLPQRVHNLIKQLATLAMESGKDDDLTMVVISVEEY
ncbi:MAG: PP2C family protein-serine/threonine phosphatase, partial [Acidobacteriota bacterium]